MHEFLNRLMRLTESGLTTQWGRRYLQTSPCLVKHSLDPERRILRFNDIFFPLVLLVVGWACALLTYLIELCLSLKQKWKQVKTQVEMV